MSDEKQQQLYISRNPGDLITAEDWNEIQRKIKGDIDKAQASIDQIQKMGVDKASKAEDADKFANKTPDKWKEELDERYVQHSELRSGWGEYRRYFKQLEDLTRPAIIEHNLHRYPLVNIYELQSFVDLLVEIEKDVSTDSRDNLQNIKFFLYYEGHIDPAAGKLKSGNYKHSGDSLEILMTQFGMSKEDGGQLFYDLLNDLWGKMFDTENEQDHFEIESCGFSKWIQDNIIDHQMSVGNVIHKRLWDNLRIAIRPQMMPIGAYAINSGEVIDKRLTEKTKVDVVHVSQDALEIHVTPLTEGRPLDLMVLLRT
jgi:hypothetical protein